jgi:hypothetical protein
MLRTNDARVRVGVSRDATMLITRNEEDMPLSEAESDT